MLRGIRSGLLLAGLAAGLVGSGIAQEIPQEGPVPTTALVRVQSKGDVRLDPKALSLEVNGHATPIQAVAPASAGNVEVAILIDDGLRQNFGLQSTDIQDFVNSLPNNVKVLIGYMQNGSIRSSGRFTSDRQELSGALRIPMGIPGSSASPYFCLSDFVKNWPSQEHAARFVLMITNGVDPYNGAPTITNQDSPYVDAAGTDSIRAGAAVYSIYFPLAGFRGGRGSLSGQTFLQQVADATGGDLFNQGSIPPVSIGPYLNQFGKAIQSSYEVAFLAPATRKPNETARIRLKTSQGGVKLRAPQAVKPGLAEMRVSVR